MNLPHSNNKRGFTVVELIVGTIIGLVVVAVAGIGLQAAVRFIAESRAYSVASRSATTSFEQLLAKMNESGDVSIEKASNVELIYPADEATAITKFAIEEEGWHYVKLASDPNDAARGNYVALVREWDAGSGKAKEEPIPGSEHVESLSFEGKVFAGETNLSPAEKADLLGARVLVTHIGVTSTVDNQKTRVVSRDRSLAIRNSRIGIMAFNAASPDKPNTLPTPPADGRAPMLRYLADPDEPPTLDQFGSSNEEGINPSAVALDGYFDYGQPDTWTYLEPFHLNTYIDAVLTFPQSLQKVLDPAAPPKLTLIAFDQTAFSSALTSVGIDFKGGAAKPADIEEAKEWSDKLLTLLKARIVENATFKFNNPTVYDVPLGDLKANPFDANDMKILLTTDTDETSSGKYKMRNRFSFTDTRAEVFPEYNGAYLIMLAHYKKQGVSEWGLLASFVQLGNYSADTLFTDIMKEVMASTHNQAGSPTHFNYTQAKYGTITYDAAANKGRGTFTVTGNSGGSSASPKVMIELGEQYFSHMQKAGKPVLYGATNYALYVDAELPVASNATIDGGYGIFLNSSEALKNGNADEWFTSGYVFQFDPAACGFPIRYFGYGGAVSAYNELTGGVSAFGARPMYFYDAAKPGYPAPKAITYFTGATGAATATENFNLNAGAAAGDSVNYRLPFRAVAANYQNEITYDITVNTLGTGNLVYGFTVDNANNLRRANRRDLHLPTAAPNGARYGVSENYHSVYFPKLMQSWHMYPGTNPSDMTTGTGTGSIAAGTDNRIGYRWDRGWNVDTATWRLRHILKLTLLEITQNITPTMVTSDWRADIHHTGAATGNAAVIHEAGDMFVRVEMIQIRPGGDPYNSRDYIYSKPIWYGKFKGDSWSGGDPSPFKKMSNKMPTVVADMEPKYGDSQSYRRRGMHVRSWKDAFNGWDFTNYNQADAWYSRKSINTLPPDFDRDGKVWTPPIAIDLNASNAAANANNITQSGNNTNATTFGLYQDTAQRINRENRTGYAYNGSYANGNKLYGRLSLLRNQGNATPIHGLYALRGWDYGTNYVNNVTYDTTNATTYNSKRFLTVVQGLRLPYMPYGVDAAGNAKTYYHRDPTGTTNPPLGHARDEYRKDRKRIIGYRFWSSNVPFKVHDTWIGEGFAPWEVREILGLPDTLSDTETIALYEYRTTTP
ncbi:hypothetical protein FACS1894216_05950 [Synergistales bacterium]|nr:hypothetical protein FACS1894216_05950 [Synergistales bacterium]